MWCVIFWELSYTHLGLIVKSSMAERWAVWGALQRHFNLNCKPLELEATALPTEPQSLPSTLSIPKGRKNKCSAENEDRQMGEGQNLIYWKGVRHNSIRDEGRKSVARFPLWTHFVKKDRMPLRIGDGLGHCLDGAKDGRWSGCYLVIKSNNGREPWSSGYGWRLMFEWSWVRILAPNTGWIDIFSDWFVVKIVLMFVWKDRK